MTKEEVTIGMTYLAKVSNMVVPVRIDAEHARQGWFGTNQVTGKKVHIKSAQRLRGEVGRDGTPDAGAATPEAQAAESPALPALPAKTPEPPAAITEIELVDDPQATTA